MRLPWHREDQPSTQQLIRLTEERLDIMTAAAAAVERRSEVLATVEAAADFEQAVTQVAELLAIGQVGATVVLDLQVRQLTQRDRRRIVLERDELREILAELRARPDA